MRFGLLGPVAVWDDGRSVALGGPQQRALLALLLLHRNALVTIDRALDALWPAELPPNALPVLRTYVSRLRAAGVPLETRDHGYALAAETDADEFARLLASGRARREAGDPLNAETLLTEALALVRGPPLNELPDDDTATRERERLLELQAEAAEELVEARLAQGRHRELVAELRAAAGLRERTWGQLMVALYRSGRQAEALGAYRDATRALALNPGEQLQNLQRLIVAQDPALDLPPAPGRPHYATSFVGRNLTLPDARLVTITGPAGVGKTRLAAEASAARWWVELAPVEPGRVVAAVARALAVPELPGRAPIDLVVARAHDTPGLLVLDNCEHVLPEAAEVTARVLAGAPGARVVATSREPLRLAEERVHALAGLDPPDAAQLFRDRAGADGDVAHLDGLPLAIELAAGAHGRGYVLRHRTLEAAISWSVDLLPTHEQKALHALGVFPGSFDAAAAEAVGGIGPTHLVSASLLAADRGRFRLLQTVRDFTRPDTDAARRHRDHYMTVAEEVGRNMVGSGLPVWLPRGRLEHENFHAALRYSLDRGEGEPALQMAGALGWYFFRVSRPAEGRALLEQALALAAADSPWRPRALVGRAWITVASGDPDWVAVADEAVAACPDGWLRAEALAARAQALTAAGALPDARVEIIRARDAAIAADHTEGIAFVDNMLGVLLLKEGDLDAAESVLRSAHDGMCRMRGTRYAGYTLMDLARVKVAQRQPEAALEIVAQALEDFERREDPRGVAAAKLYAGRAHLLLGQDERGRAEIDAARALCDRWGFVGLASEISA